MPYLAGPVKGNEKKWEVRWWLTPHFIAADSSLHRHVDQKLTEKFRKTPPSESSASLMVIGMIMEKYPYPNLETVLKEMEEVEIPS